MISVITLLLAVLLPALLAGLVGYQAMRNALLVERTRELRDMLLAADERTARLRSENERLMLGNHEMRLMLGQAIGDGYLPRCTKKARSN